MNFLKSFKQKKIEQKSAIANGSFANASMLLDSAGNIINTIFYTNESEIRQNASVGTVISKQCSIINEGNLVIKEEKNGYKEITTKSPANEFLKWLYNPNTFPSPNNIVHIIDHLMSEYYRSGVSGLIFTFKNTGSLSMANKKNIKLAQSVNIGKTGGRIYYIAQFDDGKSYNFTYNLKYLNFARETDEEIQILFVIGNYDVRESEYKSTFCDQIDYVLLQNYLIKFANSFHKNSCFPSQIVKISYKGVDAENVISDMEMAKFKKAIDEFKQQYLQNKGSKNAGGIIIPSHPALEVDVVPLSIPTNATENIAYHNLVAEKLFSFVDGGSKSAYEGQSEYSNNASAKLLDAYDGTFRIFNSVVLTPLNIFMKNLFLVMLKPIENASIGISTSNIKIYQKQDIATIVMLTQNNLLWINDGIKKIAVSSELFSDLQPKPTGDVFNSELSGNKTKTNPTIESKK